MPRILTGKEAMDERDFERVDKGLPPQRKVAMSMPEPKYPEVENVLRYTQELGEGVTSVVDVKRGNKKNVEGTRFVGFDVVLEVKGGKTVTGWMPEPEYLRLRRTLNQTGRVNTDLMP